MEVTSLVFDFPPLPDVIGNASAVTKRTKPAFRVQMDAMVNTKTVKAGDVLTLPFKVPEEAK